MLPNSRVRACAAPLERPSVSPISCGSPRLMAWKNGERATRASTSATRSRRASPRGYFVPGQHGLIFQSWMESSCGRSVPAEKAAPAAEDRAEVMLRIAQPQAVEKRAPPRPVATQPHLFVRAPEAVGDRFALEVGILFDQRLLTFAAHAARAEQRLDFRPPRARVLVETVNAGDVEARDATAEDFIQDLAREQVAIGLEHDLRASGVSRPQRIEDRVELGPLGKRFTAGEDQPVETRGQALDDCQAILGGNAVAARTGVIVAMRAGIIAELREDPVYRLVMLEMRGILDALR